MYLPARVGYKASNRQYLRVSKPLIRKKKCPFSWEVGTMTMKTAPTPGSQQPIVVCCIPEREPHMEWWVGKEEDRPVRYATLPAP